MISKNTQKSPAWLINTAYVDSKPLVAYGYSSRTRGGTYGTTAQHLKRGDVNSRYNYIEWKALPECRYYVDYR